MMIYLDGEKLKIGEELNIDLLASPILFDFECDICSLITKIDNVILRLKQNGCKSL